MTTYNITATKINEVITFDDSTLPRVSVEWIMEYGLKQKIQDCHASIKRTAYPDGDDGTAKWLIDVRKAVYEVRDNFVNGNPGARKSGVDPEAAVAAKYGMPLDEFRAMMAGRLGVAEKKRRQAA